MTKQEKSNIPNPNNNDITSEAPETVHAEIPEQEMKNSKKQCEAQEKRIGELEKALKIAQKNESEAMLRARAEIENNRKRMVQEIEKANKFALERFVNELLPVIDNLERALSAANKDNPNFKATVDGIELTLKSLLDAVKKFGIEQISPQIDDVLNPELHQAISVSESQAHQSGHILQTIQKGYTLNGRLVRPAMVIVTK